MGQELVKLRRKTIKLTLRSVMMVITITKLMMIVTPRDKTATRHVNNNQSLNQITDSKRNNLC